MNKKVIFITFDGLTDPLGQSQILPYLKGIASSGFRIHILSCEKPENLNGSANELKNELDKWNITWSFINYDVNGNFLSRWKYVMQLRKLAGQIIAKEKISLIHCRSYQAALIGLYFKRKLKIPFLFDMRGFWADERIDGGIWNTAHPVHAVIYLYFKWKERQFLKKSDAVISLTDSAAKYIAHKFNIREDKISVIPCSVDLQLFDRRNASDIIIPGISEKDYVMIYVGSLGTWYLTKELFDMAIVWRRHIPDFKLLVLTKDIGAFDEYKSTVKEDNSFIIAQSAPYKKVPSYLAKARIAAYFIKPCFSKMASSPTKMAECWAMGLPVVTNNGIGDIDYLINQKQGGILIHSFTDEEFLHAYQQSLKITSDPAHYRNLAEEHFNLEKAVNTYTSVYTKLSS